MSDTPSNSVSNKDLVDVIEKVAQDKPENITLSTGVVLRGKQAPPLVLISIMAEFPRPVPPTYLNKQLGRMTENPDDPDYLDRVKDWETRRNTRILDALIVLGTEVVSIPKTMSGYKDKQWLDEYRILNLEIFPDNNSWRYLTWIKFKAAVVPEDLSKIQEAVGRLSGVPESTVQAAEDFSGSDRK